MSLAYNDTTAFRGIIQMLEKECGFKRGDISGDSNKLKEFTADINLAFDDFWALAIPAGGTWQLDDSNFTDYPIITTALVANQRDYTFTTDEGGNLILDVYKVLVADSSGTFSEVSPIDVQSETDTLAFHTTDTGTPTRYDKTGNGIFLDPIPSYSRSGGLKVYINREASYFTTSDTTKKPGVPGLFHAYFYLKPALAYARRHVSANYQLLDLQVARMEEQIRDYYGLREKDVRKRLSVGQQDNR